MDVMADYVCMYKWQERQINSNKLLFNVDFELEVKSEEELWRSMISNFFSPQFDNLDTRDGDTWHFGYSASLTLGVAVV